MLKLVVIIILSLVINSNANANSLIGSGEIKFNEYNLKAFERYLSDGTHNKKEGQSQKKGGKGAVFAVTIDGSYSGYYYCYRGYDCNVHTAKTGTINHCQKKAKKKFGIKKKCKIFAIKRTILWNDSKIKIPKNIDVKKFLEDLGYYEKG